MEDVVTASSGGLACDTKKKQKKKSERRRERERETWVREVTEIREQTLREREQRAKTPHLHRGEIGSQGRRGSSVRRHQDGDMLLLLVCRTRSARRRCERVGRRDEPREQHDGSHL